MGAYYETGIYYNISKKTIIRKYDIEAKLRIETIVAETTVDGIFF